MPCGVNTGNGWTLATVSAWKNSVNAMVGGVGILIGPRALKSQNRIERIQPRMMATPEQQSSPTTAQPMLVKKLNLSPPTMSYPL